jgi:uncharacterized protein (DUF427 family)
MALPSESVWEYPRPPRLEPVAERIRIQTRGIWIADTVRAYRILETSHPPTYYLPPEDVRMDLLTPAAGAGSVCEFKGRARYYDLEAAGRRISHAAWAYPQPAAAYAAIAGYLAFYASKEDACYVGEVRAQAQEGDFYGGWITPNLRGPFKGAPGTWGW